MRPMPARTKGATKKPAEPILARPIYGRTLFILLLVWSVALFLWIRHSCRVGRQANVICWSSIPWPRRGLRSLPRRCFTDPCVTDPCDDWPFARQVRTYGRELMVGNLWSGNFPPRYQLPKHSEPRRSSAFNPVLSNWES